MLEIYLPIKLTTVNIRRVDIIEFNEIIDSVALVMEQLHWV